MKNLTINETPVRTSNNFKINNITLEDLEIPTNLRKFENAEIICKSSKIESDFSSDNLTYGNKNTTKEEVEKVLEKARLSSFLNQLPNGYDTIIKDGGSNISKGQKQLLTIARAMLLNANMLILDEATSNVDTRTEIKIQGAMKELMKDKTTFIIAHRLSTIQSADLMLVVKDGNIIEQSNHQQLLKQYGFYYELYNSQFK